MKESIAFNITEFLPPRMAISSDCILLINATNKISFKTSVVIFCEVDRPRSLKRIMRISFRNAKSARAMVILRLFFLRLLKGRNLPDFFAVFNFFDSFLAKYSVYSVSKDRNKATLILRN